MRAILRRMKRRLNILGRGEEGAQQRRWDDLAVTVVIVTGLCVLAILAGW